MPQSYSGLYIHLIFSTKNRANWISRDVQEPFHTHLGFNLKEVGCVPVIINSVADHVHVLFELSRTIAISDVVQQIKAKSSQWMKKQDQTLEGFAWQKGYGAFTVSMSQVETVSQYIMNQEEHHRRQSFQDEYRQFPIRHNIAFDEKYIWE